MALHHPLAPLRVHIPDVDMASVAADRQLGTVFRPTNGGDVVAVEFAEAGDLGSDGVPQVDAVAQPDGQHILVGPGNQVQVKVVSQGRCIEYFEWIFLDFPVFLVGVRLAEGQDRCIGGQVQTIQRVLVILYSVAEQVLVVEELQVNSLVVGILLLAQQTRVQLAVCQLVRVFAEQLAGINLCDGYRLWVLLAQQIIFRVAVAIDVVGVRGRCVEFLLNNFAA